MMNIEYSYRESFFGFPFDNVSKEEIKNMIIEFIYSDRKHYISVLNANKIYQMSLNIRLQYLVENSDLILPENAINIVSFLSGKKLKDWNIGGYPTMKDIISIAKEKGFSLYFLGSTDQILKKMVGNLKNKYPKINIVGFYNGYFNKNKEKKIISEINKKKPFILFVGMGSPKQELWIAKNLSQLNVKIAMGVGGSFKVLAGHEKEAPFWTKFGIEWMYRSFQDPVKFKRYIVTNTYFIFKLLKYKLDSNQSGN